LAGVKNTMNPEPRHASTIFLYGPPGSGKSTTGKLLAEDLRYDFFDLDVEIEKHCGCTVAQIFDRQGEAGFRELEQQQIRNLFNERVDTIHPADTIHPKDRAGGRAVIALGGGALTVSAARAFVEANGTVLCLDALPGVLLARLQADPTPRPLLASGGATELAGAKKLIDLLSRRADHYASFALRLDTTRLDPVQAAWQAQVLLGRYCVAKANLPYEICVQPGGIDTLGDALAQQGLQSPFALVADTHTAPLYASRVIASLDRVGLQTKLIVIPAGESFKTLATAQILWDHFLDAGLERGSTVVALGGGVVGDLSGFAASTYLRGIRWVNVPTTLLAMVDSSLGGKTGVDIARGKNLVGAFHPPAFVLADPDVLASLPEAELRSGMAEVIKHGIIADPGLLELCTPKAWVGGKQDRLVSRAMAVKIGIIELDPYEKGVRAALNFGHTIGHAVELVSGYRIRHGEAVAIGMVVEARLAERLGLAEPGLSHTIAAICAAAGLQTGIPADLDRTAIRGAVVVDKKKSQGRVRFALPVRIGEVKIGVDVPDDVLSALLAAEI
jgi:shikimate kinase / 3-dehydroquinate synthase